MAKIFILDPKEIIINPCLKCQFGDKGEPCPAGGMKFCRRFEIYTAQQAVLAHAKEIDIDEKIREWIDSLEGHYDEIIVSILDGDYKFSQFLESQTGEKKP